LAKSWRRTHEKRIEARRVSSPQVCRCPPSEGAGLAGVRRELLAAVALDWEQRLTSLCPASIPTVTVNCRCDPAIDVVGGLEPAQHVLLVFGLNVVGRKRADQVGARHHRRTGPLALPTNPGAEIARCVEGRSADRAVDGAGGAGRAGDVGVEADG